MKSELEQGREYAFAGFRVDLAARLLTKLDGTPVKLNSRAFDTLAVLVTRPGEILSKRHLLHAVWPDVVVGDNNLNQAVAAIRRALGDSDELRRIVQTVPGRGFCFVADVCVQSVEAPADPAQRETTVSVADYF